MPKTLYFARTDDDIAFSNDIIQTHYFMTGDKINPEDTHSIRKAANDMAGILYELDRPSVERLVKHRHVVSAVRLYRELHDCTLKEAHDAVQKIVERGD
jgi:hypothetical protein